ncbi:hypothetical protein [Sinosporangium siamense]|uniref:Uncharacterized protein n=1 Tax=Sinosporangium siamense TaxID=1367973 RepID=A0A919VB77_9ACTN|nr:hypothetical protein [Sinosporangium siamense]GII96212.1 hypothetical protein Ssi02_64430 [Sinosporangium siamense]
MFGYTGSGPYCYTSCLGMVFGPEASPPLAIIETLTGSPFGVQLERGTMPWFDPYGWSPEIGVDDALALLGWRCTRSDGGTPEEALARLRAACADGPVVAGPVDMGLLLYRPGTPIRGGGDHYVVVIAVDGDAVLLHDPHGHPYATLPAADFVEAWKAETVTYIDLPYVMRSGFVREREVDAADALRASLPGAVAWLSGRDDLPTAPGSLGGAAAVEALAGLVRQGLDADTRFLLEKFGIRLAARRLGDAAMCLTMVGADEAAAIADEQARLIGSLQHPLVTGDGKAVEAGLLRLAPTYERLREALVAGQR